MNDAVEEGIEIDALEDYEAASFDAASESYDYEDFEIVEESYEDVEVGVEVGEEISEAQEIFEDGTGVEISGIDVSSNITIVEENQDFDIEALPDPSGEEENNNTNVLIRTLQESTASDQSVDSSTQSFYDFVTSYLEGQEHNMDDLFSQMSILNANLEVVNNNLVASSQNDSLEAKYVIGVLFAIFGAFLIYAAFSKFS